MSSESSKVSTKSSPAAKAMPRSSASRRLLSSSSIRAMRRSSSRPRAPNTRRSSMRFHSSGGRARRASLSAAFAPPSSAVSDPKPTRARVRPKASAPRLEVSTTTVLEKST